METFLSFIVIAGVIAGAAYLISAGKGERKPRTRVPRSDSDEKKHEEK